MRYTEVMFTLNGEPWRQDLLAYDLAELGFETFESTDNGFNAYVASDKFQPIALENLLDQLPKDFLVRYETLEIASENWNKVWESNFDPIVLGKDCRVRAAFHSFEEGYTYDLVIEPKMAFGTGHHQTTSLMMRYLLEEEITGKTVLDMGCGTGILAILASMRGAERLVAIDNDPVCYESVLENARLNGIINLEARLGSVAKIPTKVGFDCILANINRNILLDHLSFYFSALKDEGTLFISGFYEGEDLDKLKTASLNCGFYDAGHKVQDGWVAAKFVKNG